jgi:hypothetical protein
MSLSLCAVITRYRSPCPYAGSQSHAKALADVGWSVPEFDNGIKAGHVDTNASPSSLKLKNMIRTVSVRKQASEQIRQLKEAAARLMREKALNVREIIIYAMFMVVFTALSARGLNDEVRFRHHSALKSIIVGTSATNLYARVNTRETAADWLTSEFAAGLATQVGVHTPIPSICLVVV